MEYSSPEKSSEWGVTNLFGNDVTINAIEEIVTFGCILCDKTSILCHILFDAIITNAADAFAENLQKNSDEEYANSVSIDTVEIRRTRQLLTCKTEGSILHKTAKRPKSQKLVSVTYLLHSCYKLFCNLCPISNSETSMETTVLLSGSILGT